MARTKKEKIGAIKKYAYSDKKALTGLAKTGIMEEKDLLQFITNNRIETYLHKDNNLIQECYCNKYNVTYYKLTEDGKNLVKEKYSVTGCSIGNVTYDHNRLVRDDYMKMSESEQERALSEQDFRNFVWQKVIHDKHSYDDERRDKALELEEGLRNGTFSLPDLGTIKDEDYTPSVQLEIKISDFTVYESVTINYKQSQIDAKNAFATTANCTMNMSYTYK